MRYGLFEDVKLDPTLLLWAASGSDLAPLLQALEELALGARPNVALDASVGALPADGVQVRIDLADKDCIFVSSEGANREVRIFLTPAKFKLMHDRLRAQAERPRRSRRIAVGPDQPLQIMVSVGEYPDQLRPF